MQIWLLVQIVKTVNLIKTNKHIMCVWRGLFLCVDVLEQSGPGLMIESTLHDHLGLLLHRMYQPQGGPPKGNVMVGIA